MNGIKSNNSDDILFPKEKEKLLLKKIKIKFAMLLLISNSILFLLMQPQKVTPYKDSVLNLSSKQNVIINLALINHSPFLDNVKNEVTIYSKNKKVLINQATLLKVMNNHGKDSNFDAKTYLVEMHKDQVVNIINQKNDQYFLSYPKDATKPIPKKTVPVSNKRKKNYEIIF